MKKLIPLLLVVSVLISCKEKDNKAKIEQEDVKEMLKNAKGLNEGDGTFTIEGIDGWEKKTESAMGVNSTFILSPLENATDSYRENISVVTEKFPSSLSFEDYVEMNKSNLKKFIPTSELLETTSTSIDGNQAKAIHYTHTLQGIDLDALVYILSKNNMAYVITCTAKKGKLDTYKKEFDQIIASFKVS